MSFFLWFLNQNVMQSSMGENVTNRQRKRQGNWKYTEQERQTKKDSTTKQQKQSMQDRAWHKEHLTESTTGEREEEQASYQAPND